MLSYLHSQIKRQIWDRFSLILHTSNVLCIISMPIEECVGPYIWIRLSITKAWSESEVFLLALNAPKQNLLCKIS